MFICLQQVHLYLFIESFSEEPPEAAKSRLHRSHNEDDINDNHDPENEYLEYLEGVGSRLASHWYVTFNICLN